MEGLRRRYAALYRRIPSPSTDEATYVDRFVQNQVAVTQRRAATALAQIGALDSLEAALRTSVFRSDVVDHMERLLLAAGRTLIDPQGPAQLVVLGPASSDTNPRVRRCVLSPLELDAIPLTCQNFSGDPQTMAPPADDGVTRFYEFTVEPGYYEITGSFTGGPPRPDSTVVLPLIEPGQSDTVRFGG
jgi:hypothetical protein